MISSSSSNTRVNVYDAVMVSSCHSHCNNSSSSLRECRVSARWWLTLKPSHKADAVHIHHRHLLLCTQACKSYTTATYLLTIIHYQQYITVTGAANCLPCSCRHPAPLPRTVEQALMPTYLCISQALSPVNKHKVWHQRQQLAVKVPIQACCHSQLTAVSRFTSTSTLQYGNTVLLSTYTHISKPVGNGLGHLLSNPDSEWLVQNFHVADWFTEVRRYIPLDTN